MLTSQRFSLFLLCLSTRFMFAYIAYKYVELLPIMGLLALIPALGFAVIYIGDLRKIGLEVNGEQIWWNDLRPFHASLYFLFAILAMKKSKHAWKVLALDATIGFFSFLIHHHFVCLQH